MNRSEKLSLADRPLVIGHRGYCQFAPENTLPSFELALAVGVDLIELDCHQTKDGVLVVIHDSNLNRTTDARKRWKQRNNSVRSRTAFEIEDLDAGSWFHQRFARTKVPTLSVALETITRGSIALIERKSGDAAGLVKLLRQRRLMDKVIVQSFDWHFLRALHVLAPELVLGALGPPKFLSSGRKPAALLRRLNRHWLRSMDQTGATIVVWNQQVSQKAIRLAHQKQIKVWVYTVNTERRARRLLRIGVDGLITDNPSLVWKAMAVAPRKHLREP